MYKNTAFAAIRRVSIIAAHWIWVVVKVLIYMIVFVVLGLCAVAKQDIERP